MFLTATVLVALLAALTPGQEEFDTYDPTDEGVTTGPDVGEPIPAFEARDADGKSWTFDSLKGPRGAVILFYRSADW